MSDPSQARPAVETGVEAKIALALNIQSFTWLEAGGEKLVLIRLADEDPAVDGLTLAEKQALSELLAGKSNREIGLALGRAERTVANQVASIFRKTKVASRRELVAKLRATQVSASRSPQKS